MAIQASNAIMEAMGFSKWPEGLDITASFHALHVYEVQGIVMEDASVTPFYAVACGIPYRACIGSSLNAISQALLQDDFCQSEEDWQKEKSATPPYLVVHFGPAGPFSAVGDFIMQDKHEITTYSSFREARFALASMADKSLASISTSISIAFCNLTHDVRLLYRDRAVFGLTEDGRTVHDIWLQVSSSGYGSSRLVRKEVESRLQSGLELAKKIYDKYSRFMRLAADESDGLKKFLYYFLAMEVIVHSVFKANNKRIDYDTVGSLPVHAPTTAQFFLTVRNKNNGFKNLKDRFVCCLLFEWTHLNDEDFIVFSSVKKGRDEIAHGEISNPPESIVLAAERLALKLGSSENRDQGKDWDIHNQKC